MDAVDHKRTSQIVVCIDPGHPSDYSQGTRGSRTTEIAVNWLYAQLLQKDLKKIGITVVLTKQSQGQNVSNRRRAEIANSSNAALMLRLHCDGRTKRGVAIYCPTRIGVAADGTRGPSPNVIEQSEEAANRFHVAMRESLRNQLPDLGLMGDEKTDVGARQGALTGSIYSKVPVVLIEMCNLQNHSDENYVLSVKGKLALTKAMVNGILSALSLQRDTVASR